MNLLRNLPQYEYMKMNDVPGNVQLTTKMSMQDNLVMYKPEVIIGDEVSACQRAYLPELTKVNRNTESAKIKKVIKYEPVITPFEIWNTNPVNDNYPSYISDDGEESYLIEEKDNNFSQMDVMILTTWLRGFINSQYEIVYFSRIYDGIKRLILVLMRNNEVYPMNVEEASSIQMLVDKYSFSDKALLIDLRDNLVLDGKICHSSWLSSVIPFLEMEDITINEYHVVTDNILMYNEIYDTLMDNIIDMWYGAYLVAIPLYHKDIINKWKLISYEVDINGINPQLQILVHPNWSGEDARLENVICLLERQLSGDTWIDIKMPLDDNVKHVISLYLESLDIVFKYYQCRVFFQCDNYDEMVKIIKGMENVARNYTGDVIKTLIIDENSDIDIKVKENENSALYYDYLDGKMVLKWSLMKI